MSLFIDPAMSRQILSGEQQLESLPGYCIWIDMVSSTAAKTQASFSWLHRTCDLFQLAKGKFRFAPLKMIGDALMYYIATSTLRTMGTGRAIDELFGPLCHLVQEPEEDDFGRVKAAIVYCENAYDVTFFEGRDDVYGKDIDLTARLLSVAEPGEIVMNEAFVERIRCEDSDLGYPHSCRADLERVADAAEVHPFKGFERPVRFFRVPSGGDSLKNLMKQLEIPSRIMSVEEARSVPGLLEPFGDAGDL